MRMKTQTPNSWVALPMVARPDQYQLCGQTDHLSIFALAMQPQGGIPITGGTLVPTGSMTPTATINPAFSPTHSNGDGSGLVATPVSTQAALTATSVALTATDVPPTSMFHRLMFRQPYAPPTICSYRCSYLTATATDPPAPTATDLLHRPILQQPIHRRLILQRPILQPTDPPAATEPPVVP